MFILSYHMFILSYHMFILFYPVYSFIYYVYSFVSYIYFHSVYFIYFVYKISQTFLKEILKEICVYNMKAPNKNTYELKMEYRHYKPTVAAASAASVPVVTAPSTSSS